MKIFTIANLKGGCSKTTSFMHIGGEIANLGNRILGIDADPQMSAYKWWLKGGVEVFGFPVIPLGDKKLSDLIRDNKNDFDYFMIDCPPNKDDLDKKANLITYNALLISNAVITPMICSTVDLKVLDNVYEIIKEVQKSRKENFPLKSFVLLTHYFPSRKLSKSVEKNVRDKKKLPILETKLGYREAYKLSDAYSRPVSKLPTKDKKAILEIENLAKEIIKELLVI